MKKISWTITSIHGVYYIIKYTIFIPNFLVEFVTLLEPHVCRPCSVS